MKLDYIDELLGQNIMFNKIENNKEIINLIT